MSYHKFHNELKEDCVQIEYVVIPSPCKYTLSNDELSISSWLKYHYSKILLLSLCCEIIIMTTLSDVEKAFDLPL